MEVQFINQYEITVPLLRQWSRYPVTQKAKKARQKGLAMSLFGCAASLAIVVSSIFMQNISITVLGGLFLALFIYRLFVLPRLALKKQYDQFTRVMGTDVWKRIITFGEDITIEDGRNTQHYNYTDISQIQETDDYFYLPIKNEVGIRVRKDSFVKGSAIGFNKFIKQRMKSVKSAAGR